MPGTSCRCLSSLSRLGRRLRLHTFQKRVLIGVALVALLALANVVTIGHVVRQSDNLAATINVAGKLRMLGQRITHKVLNPLLVDRSGQQAELQALHDEFEHILGFLVRGGEMGGRSRPAMPATLQPFLESLDHAWQAYALQLEKVKGGLPGPYSAVFDEVLAADSQLLLQAEVFVQQLVRYAEQLQRRLLLVAYALFAVNLLVLILAWWMIRRRVLQPMNALMAQSSAMATGHFHVRSDVNASHELQLLSRTLNDSAQYIQNLLDKLQREHDALRQAEESNRLAALVYHNTSQAMVVTDPDGYIRDINPAFTVITGYQASEVQGRSMSLLSSGRHDRAFYQSLWASLLQTGQWVGDIHNRRKSGEIYIQRLSISTSYDEDGSVNCRVGLFSDVTQKRQQEALIWHQAHHDQLTDLPNRKLFHERLSQSIEKVRSDGSSFALLFLDLDLFKEVNDRHGHHEGDRLLRKVAGRLRSVVSPTDCVARLGGDEFTLILHDVDSPDALRPVCEHILSVVSAPYTLSSGITRVSASLGVTFCPQDGVDATDLLRFADQAMYVAKEQGRGRYRYYSGAIHERMRERRKLQRELREALDRRELVLHYQPIVSMPNGCIVRTEALLRWRHPRLGMLEPQRFIDLAEETGLIVPIGDWVFREALQQLAQWREGHAADLHMSINVSPVQFQEGGLQPSAWVEYMRQLGLPCTSLTVEITEGLLMGGDDVVLQRLQELRAAGIQIALDDFGTGYSSFAYLKRFSLDYLKIDRSFVNHLAKESDDWVLCQAMAAMAHRLGIQVVAEGVRSTAQRDLLIEMGCTLGQGAGYCVPVPPERMVHLLGKPLTID